MGQPTAIWLAQSNQPYLRVVRLLHRTRCHDRGRRSRLDGRKATPGFAGICVQSAIATPSGDWSSSLNLRTNQPAPRGEVEAAAPSHEACTIRERKADRPLGAPIALFSSSHAPARWLRRPRTHAPAWAGLPFQTARSTGQSPVPCRGVRRHGRHLIAWPSRASAR